MILLEHLRTFAHSSLEFYATYFRTENSRDRDERLLVRKGFLILFRFIRKVVSDSIESPDKGWRKVNNRPVRHSRNAY